LLPAPPAPPTGAKVVVNTPLVNARSGPGLDFDVVAVVERGEEFDITGKSADGQWWRVCCTADGETVWIIDQLVDTDGPVDAVPVVDASDVPAPVFSPGKVKAEVNIPLLNARSGPNATADLIAIVEGGETFDVLAANDARDWYQVCCVLGAADAEGQPTTPAWVASSVVTTTTGVPDLAVVSADPILEDGLEATWDVDWECRSDRCAVKECKATVTATADSPDQQYLQVEHKLTWDDACFNEDSWIFEVDRYTGKERTGDFADNFLYSYWIGSDPDEVNGVYRYSDDQGIAVWCSDEEDVEIEEGDGWTTIYQGSTCHDVKTGVLVLLEYTKRWLYTGEYDGNTYNRAYFGDSETLEQRLVDTNIDMEFVTPVE
jgi:SH3-like domain-containing protein